MNREDWHAYLESTPPTANQVGRIRAEFERLGWYGQHERRARLAITAVLAGTDLQLSSTHDLTQGQAGRAVWALLRCRSSADLPVVPADVGDQGMAAGPAVTTDSGPVSSPGAAEVRVALAELASALVYAFTRPVEMDVVRQLAGQLEERRR